MADLNHRSSESDARLFDDQPAGDLSHRARSIAIRAEAINALRNRLYEMRARTAQRELEFQRWEHRRRELGYAESYSIVFVAPTEGGIGNATSHRDP